jgi:hypothetical protein
MTVLQFVWRYHAAASLVCQEKGIGAELRTTETRNPRRLHGILCVVPLFF